MLLEKGYEVHGLVRSTASRREALSKPLRPGLTMHLGDMSDLGRLVQILGGIKPDEIYHLAAESHVAVSFDTPLQTSDTNAMGTLRLLEAMRMLGLDKSTKFYNVTFLYLASDNTKRLTYSCRLVHPKCLGRTCPLHKQRRPPSTRYHHMLLPSCSNTGLLSIFERHTASMPRMVFSSTMNHRDGVPLSSPARSLLK